MATVEQIGRREVRGGGTAAGYARSGNGRSIDDVRRRGREAQTATRGATALALPPLQERPGTAPVGPGRLAPERPAGPARDAGPARGNGSARGAAAPPRIAPPPRPVSTPRAPFVTLILFVVIVGVLGILVINTKINENVFQLHDLKAQQSDLDRQEQRLQKEIAQRESPGSLAAAARQHGLVRADAPAYLRLPDGRQLGVPRPAAGPPSASGGSSTPPVAGAAKAPGQPGG